MRGKIHLLLIAVFSIIILVGGLVSEPSAEDRAESIGARIMCPVCQGAAIANSPSETATSMMDKVEELVAAGWTDGQILDFFRDRYGESILLDPPFAGKTLLVWLLPIAALGAGIWMISQRKRPDPASLEST